MALATKTVLNGSTTVVTVFVSNSTIRDAVQTAINSTLEKSATIDVAKCKVSRAHRKSGRKYP